MAHAAVMPTSAPLRARSTIPGTQRSVRTARTFVDAVLGPAHPGGDTARLLVSELVTNAIQHSDSALPGGRVTVAILAVPGGIQVEVIDEGSAHSVPVVCEDPLGTHGRGLFLVQSLADDWGYHRGDGATTVWFRLAALPAGWLAAAACPGRRLLALAQPH